MIRFLISTISFVTIIGLYYAYALCIVPVILPELPGREPDPMGESHEELKPYQGIFTTGSWEKESKDGIQLIQVGRTIILFKEDEISGNIARLRPCTLLFLPEEPESKTQKLEEQLQQAIILRTTEHAEIEFDSDLNLSRTPFPKMKGGRLYGPVTVSSEMKEVGPHDDLYIETENVSFSETPALTTVSTAKDVRFRWGFNQGEGSILRLEIAQVNPKDPKSPKILNHVQFETLKGLQLFFPDDFETAKKSVAPPTIARAGGMPAVQSNAGGTPAVQSNAGGTPAVTNNKLVAVPALSESVPLLPIVKGGQSQADSFPLLPEERFTVAVDVPRRIVLPSVPATTIEVRCQREFFFKSDKEPDSWTAAFRGEVNAVRTNADKTQDVITCEELLLNFQSKVKGPPAKMPGPQAKTPGPLDKKSDAKESPLAGQFSDLEPVRFLAVGKLARPGQAAVPARLTSPQGGGIVMEGDRILYDLRANMLALETEKATGALTEVQIFLQNRYRIQGDKGFQYTMGQEGAFGALKSFGKGSLRGNLGDEKTPKNINLLWGAMQMLPAQDPDEILIELSQGVSIEMDEFGKMTSGTLQIWCTQDDQAQTTQTPAQTATPLQKPAAPPTAAKSAPTGAAGLQALSSGGRDNPFGAKGNLVPRRAVALEKVHFENSSGTIDVSRMDVFFRQIGPEQKTVQSRWIPHVMTQEKPRPNDLVRRYLPARARAEQGAGGFSTPLSPPMRVSPQLGNAMSLASAPHGVGNYSSINAPFNSPVRQIQHLEPLAVPGSGKMPVTLAAPAAPAAPTMPPVFGATPRQAAPLATNGPPNHLSPETAPATTTVKSQNLLGIQSGTSSLGYAITGDQMKMNVDQVEGRSYVEQIWIGGNVRIAEKVPATFQGEFVEITGDVIHIWNPSFPDTAIWIYGKQGREAVFKGKGVQMNAMKMEIYRHENEIHVKGPGRLVAAANADTKSILGSAKAGGQSLAGGTPAVQSQTGGMPSASGLPLLVQWNEGMFCDGKTVVFMGTADLNGERVKAIYQHQKVVCDVLMIHLNRFVSFFEDKSKEPIEADLIECAKDVYVENKEFDEQNRLKAYDRARFDAMQIQAKTGIFVATGSPGILQRTFVNDGSGFANKQQDMLPGGNMKLATSEGELAYLGVWFYEDIQGNFLGNRQFANIRGRVKIIYCPVLGWEDEIEIYRLNMAARRGYRMDCERLEIAQFPDPVNPNASTMELSAYENAKIEGEADHFYGRAQAIKFNQGKSLIVFDGNAWIKLDQTEIPAQRIEYNIKTRAVSTSHAQGVAAGR